MIILALVVFWYLNSKNNPTSGGNGGGGNFWSDLLPFGNKNNQNNNQGNQPTDISDYVDDSIKEVEPLKLTKVSTVPVAGYKVFQKERFVDVLDVTPGTDGAEAAKNPSAPTTEFAPALRYVAKENGNIYQTWVDRIGEKKFTDTVVPKIYEASFGKGGESVVMRYLRPNLQTVVSFVGRLPADVLGADSSTGKLEGSFLPDDTTDISFSNDGSQMFYLYELNSSGIGMTATNTGENKTEVLDFPYTEWLSTWPKDDLITLTTKASGESPGYMYFLNPISKTYNKVLGNVFGLTTLTSKDGRYVLYSNNNLDMFVFDTSTRAEQKLRIKTLPEKCVWDKQNALYCAVSKYIVSGVYPDFWYQGKTTFDDVIWKITGENFTESEFIDLKSNTENTAIDAISLSLSEKEDYLFLVNKRDSYLWELRLK